MSLRGILNLISDIAEIKKTSTPYLCGGTPRDKLMNRLDNIVDIDITTGDSSVHLLAKEVSSMLPEASYKQLGDGHAQVDIRGIKLDFSSNFLVPNIENILKKAGLKNPSPMQCELYSRDFTCNALLMSLDLKVIKDPTGLGVTDIKRKLLRTCLPAHLTLKDQPKRVVRILYLASKLGFEVDKEIIDWVKLHPESIMGAHKSSIIEKIHSALNYDEAKTIRLLSEMNLWRYIPISPQIAAIMARHRKV